MTLVVTSVKVPGDQTQIGLFVSVCGVEAGQEKKKSWTKKKKSWSVERQKKVNMELSTREELNT